MTIDDERIFFFTLTPSSFLLLPGLEKLPTKQQKVKVIGVLLRTTKFGGGGIAA